MGLETAQYIADLNDAFPVNLDGKEQGDDHLRLIKSVLQNTFPNQASAFNEIQTLNSPRTLVANDANTVIVCTATMTLPVTAVATLGTPWGLKIIADGGDITIDPNGSETVNGAATFLIPNGGFAELYNLGTKLYCTQSVQRGIIAIWSGAVASLPAGWLLCNGSNGTPDLRDKFVVGAGGAYAVSATGGSADAVVVSHTHVATVTDPGHTHAYTNPQIGSAGTDNGPGNTQANSIANGGTSGSRATGITVANATTGESGTNKNLPPYYALAYLMKA